MPCRIMGSSSTKRIRLFMSESSHSQRKANEECRSLPQFTFKPELALMAFDNRGVGQRQSLPGTFAYFFRREKRLEDSRAYFHRYAGAGIGHCDPGPVAFPPRADRDGAFPRAVLLDWCSLMAWAELTIRFSITWLNSPTRHGTRGKSTSNAVTSRRNTSIHVGPRRWWFRSPD